MNDFVTVADADSLPAGSGRTVNVAGKEFALFNHEGTFYAIDNECPHAGAPLGAGCLQDGTLFCPFHGWSFDVRTGACLTRPERSVKSYPTRVVDGKVQILITR